MPFLAVLLVALGGALGVVIAPFYLGRMRRELSRPDELAQVAGRLGLLFTHTDPAYPSSSAFRFPFELFSRGVEQTCENVMSGTLGGIDVVAFDFLYVLEVESEGADPKNHRRSEPVRYSCALATVGGHRPHVVVEPASTPVTSRADGEPVQLEWNDFNARYRVISPERPYTTELLDVDVMAWLVESAPPGLTWEVQRDQALCRAPSLDPARMERMVSALAQFARLIARGD